MLDTGYSTTQQAKAEELAARSDHWAYGVRNSDGLKFVLFASRCQPGAIYQTHINGLGCSCPAGQRGVRCYHCLAAQLAADRAQQRVERQQRNAAAYSRLYQDSELEDAW
jgi:hypothetical protein